MEILSEKDNVFEFEFTAEEREALIRFAVRRIIKDELERLEKQNPETEGNWEEDADRARFGRSLEEDDGEEWVPPGLGKASESHYG